MIERDPYLTVVAMSVDAARHFVGAGPDRLVKDAGLADSKKYKPGARVWHVYPEGVVADGHEDETHTT